MKTEPGGTTCAGQNMKKTEIISLLETGDSKNYHGNLEMLYDGNAPDRDLTEQKIILRDAMVFCYEAANGLKDLITKGNGGQMIYRGQRALKATEAFALLEVVNRAVALIESLGISAPEPMPQHPLDDCELEIFDENWRKFQEGIKPLDRQFDELSGNPENDFVAKIRTYVLKNKNAFLS